MIFPVCFNVFWCNLYGTFYNTDNLAYASQIDDGFPSRQGTPEPNEPEKQAANPAPAEDIRRIFHPHSKRQVKFQSFEAYVASNMAERPVPTDPQPWRPFRSQLDFEVAEFCTDNMLNRESSETLISLIRRCTSNPGDFTLVNQHDLDNLWELASHKCTAVGHFNT